MRHRLGALELEVVSARGALLARHRRAPDGAGALVRADEHVNHCKGEPREVVKL